MEEGVGVCAWVEQGVGNDGKVHQLSEQAIYLFCTYLYVLGPLRLCFERNRYRFLLCCQQDRLCVGRHSRRRSAVSTRVLKHIRRSVSVCNRKHSTHLHSLCTHVPTGYILSFGPCTR